MRLINVLLVVVFVCRVGYAQNAEWHGEPPLLSTFDAPDYRTWLPEASPSPQTAQKLNEIGFDAYLAGGLLDAALIWKAALLMDPANPWAHYNYAAVLAVFARGFGDFDAQGEGLPETAWDRADFFGYREAIIRHLKHSIALRPERMKRLLEDRDFDSIRGLEEYRYVLMGPDPEIERVIALAPKWYSLQTGAFLPSDTFTFNEDGTMTFAWDTRRFDVFPEVYKDKKKIDRSFEGRWRVRGDRIVVETSDGRLLEFSFAHAYDELGFITKRILIYGTAEYGDFDSHYWEGQDA